VLVGRHHPPRRRIANVLGLAAVAAAPAVGWAVGAKAGWWGWPEATSPYGTFLGVAAGLLVLFEMLIWPRKWFRGCRLGKTQAWLRLHVWLGLVSLPVTVIHSGFNLGGTLSAATLVLFLVVIASGIWGLVLQQYLPQKLLDEVPNETVAALTGATMDKYAKECRQLVLGLAAGDGADGHGGTTTAVAGIFDPLVAFQETTFGPYLERGKKSRSNLRSRHEADRQFDRLTKTLPPAAGPVLAKMEHYAGLRRQWDTQVAIAWWLHNWLIVHLPASVAMTAFMCVHAVVALKYW
jgi:hypothetical protein